MKKNFIVLSLAFLATLGLNAQTVKLSKPIIGSEVIFNEVNGIATVETEHFYKQTNNENREWYITSKGQLPQVTPNPDPEHIAGASGNAYIELLPDTRVTHGDKMYSFSDKTLTDELRKLANFSDVAGGVAVVYYKVKINKPGRYYVWVRAYSTGSEDNGVHVGFDGTWPDHGRRMQWCDGKNNWTWASAQRTEKVHCGVPKQIYLDINTAGVHDIHFSMREDGFEMDKFILTNDSNFVPQAEGPQVSVFKGVMPKAFEKVEAKAVPVEKAPATAPAHAPVAKAPYVELIGKIDAKNLVWAAKDFPLENTKFYKDKNWLAINPELNKETKISAAFPFPTNTYDMVFLGVGENDGSSTFSVFVNDKLVGEYLPPLSPSSFEEGTKYNKLFENIEIANGAKITVAAKIGSSDGLEYSRGRWSGIVFTPKGKGVELMEKSKSITTKQDVAAPTAAPKAKQIVSKDGNAEISISGELKQWHKVTLDMKGPFAKETDKAPNPYTDYRMTVTFTHESGSPVLRVPAYFATDGNAGETSATEGNIWRAHISPDKTGKWNYEVSFLKGALVATADMKWMKELAPYNGKKGSFEVAATDKTGRDFRAKGRLQYVGKNHLQFAGNGEFFFKAGTDSPETLLAFEDFDNTIAMKPKVPLKKYLPHSADYKEGDPTWKNGKGKALIGAVNYLAAKGINSMSFLTYSAAGDGDNVWPFVARNEKMNYDCSKLDQWQKVFDYAQSKGLFLHFKTQETENDDNYAGPQRNFKPVPESLDAGELGPERILYYRELIARFGYLLALNWNLGEENTQTTEVHQAMAAYFNENDPFKHSVVLHTYPQEQERNYTPLLGKKSFLNGVSLQNSWDNVFKLTLNWVNKSNENGRPWVVANDEQNGAHSGAVPDTGYKGFDPKETKYDLNDVRKQTLWGNIMAGGAGVEYYFGYKLAENDLVCEDFRSRDKSWDYCRVAINFLKDNKIPFQNMKNADALVGNTELNKDKHCLAKADEIFLISLAYVPTTTLDLTSATGSYSVEWFNPIAGGKLLKGNIKSVKAGAIVDLGKAPSKLAQDWVVLVRKK